MKNQDTRVGKLGKSRERMIRTFLSRFWDNRARMRSGKGGVYLRHKV